MWRKKFAEESAEVLISEGRYPEMMTRISGITLADLSGESVAGPLGKDTKRRKSKTVLPVVNLSIKPAPSSEQGSKNKSPVAITDPVTEIDRDSETVSVIESSSKKKDSSKGQLGLFE